MAQPLRARVVHGMLAGRLGMSEPAARSEIHRDRQQTLVSFEVDTLDVLRRLDPKRRFEPLLRRHDRRLLSSQADPALSMFRAACVRKGSGPVTHSKLNRARNSKPLIALVR
jgi:hypothetical protein